MIYAGPCSICKKEMTEQHNVVAWRGLWVHEHCRSVSKQKNN